MDDSDQEDCTTDRHILHTRLYTPQNT